MDASSASIPSEPAAQEPQPQPQPELQPEPEPEPEPMEVVELSPTLEDAAAGASREAQADRAARRTRLDAADSPKPARELAAAAKSPKTGLTRDVMLERTATFQERTGATEEIALEMLIPAKWDLEYALDLWEEQEKERRYKEDPLGIGGVTNTLWTWGSKAAESAAATAASLKSDVAAKAAEAQCEVSKATGPLAQPKEVFQSLNAYLDSVFPVDDEKAELRAEINAAEAREARFHQLFPPPGVPQNEVVIGSFTCALRQVYSCSANGATPDIPISFSGTLYVTSANACFYIDAELHGKTLTVPLVLPFARIVAISKGKSGSMIRVVLNDPAATDTEGEEEGSEQSAYIFTEFGDADMLDTALGLLEQMHDELQEMEAE
jgi:hypothetical protein